MNTFKVTRGDKTREIEAADKAEALRAFDAPEAATVEVVAKDSATVPLAEPPKCRYRVTWGPECREVYAVSETDAWSQFVGGNENSQEYKFPNTYPRLIEKLDECAHDHETQALAAPSASPVADLSANDAKDQISRMTSADKLQAIVASDTRKTVQDAASARLTELGAK